MDGAMSPYAHDPDCVAFKWKLSSRHLCDDICDLYARADLWGGWTRAFFKMTVGIMHGKLPWLYREGGAVIFLVFQSIWGSDEAGNHDPLSGSDSASIFIFFHPKA